MNKQLEEFTHIMHFLISRKIQIQGDNTVIEGICQKLFITFLKEHSVDNEDTGYKKNYKIFL